MTPTPTTDSAVSPVRDERLAEIAERSGRGHLTAYSPEDINSICRELISRRSLDTVEDETYEIGKRDGYEQAVQDIDCLTGGDGEYRYCTDGDPERHTPDAATMKQRIVDRFSEASRTPNTEMVPRPYRELKVWADEVLAAYDERIAKGGMPNAIAGLRSAYEGLAEPKRGDADFLASPPSPAEVTNERRLVYVTWAEADDDNSFPIYVDQIADSENHHEGWWSYRVLPSDDNLADIYDGHDHLFRRQVAVTSAIAVVEAMNAALQLNKKG